MADEFDDTRLEGLLNKCALVWEMEGLPREVYELARYDLPALVASYRRAAAPGAYGEVQGDGATERA